MESLKQRWKAVPATIRKPIILVIGSIFCIAALLTGWLPGPGGIPLFLIGIAILATEFEWAKRVRDRVIAQIHVAGKAFRAHKVLGTIIGLVSLAIFVSLSIFLYRKFSS